MSIISKIQLPGNTSPYDLSVNWNNIEDKPIIYIIPEDYGAVGDGTTDDTSAVQAALDAGYINHSPVYFRKKYRITTSLNVHDWCYLLGNANHDENESFILFNPSTGGTQEEPSQLFVNADSSPSLYRHSFDGLSIKKSNGFAICFGESCPIDHGSVVRRCRISTFNIVFGCFIGHVSIIEDNHFISVMYAFHTKNLTDSYILNNYISGYRPNAPYCFYGGSINHSRIQGNFFDFWFGIFLAASNSIFTDNIFDYCYLVFGYLDQIGIGISTNGLRPNFSSVVIANNSFPNCNSCNTSNDGFGSVLSTIVSSHTGDFKVKCLQTFAPRAIFVGQLKYNSTAETVYAIQYYEALNGTITGNSFNKDGFYFGFAASGTLHMAGNNYGYTAQYIEDITNYEMDITRSSNPNHSGIYFPIFLDIYEKYEARNLSTLKDLMWYTIGRYNGINVQVIPNASGNPIVVDMFGNNIESPLSGVLKGNGDGTISTATAGVDYGTYSKPNDGIPKTDFTSAVQSSLNKADTALQSVPNTYRTAAAQDTIDSGKQPIVQIIKLIQSN